MRHCTTSSLTPGQHDVDRGSTCVCVMHSLGSHSVKENLVSLVCQIVDSFKHNEDERLISVLLQVDGSHAAETNRHRPPWTHSPSDFASTARGPGTSSHPPLRGAPKTFRIGHHAGCSCTRKSDGPNAVDAAKVRNHPGNTGKHKPAKTDSSRN